MNTEDYREQLTRDIYKAMQIPYLSERHDAILTLIQDAYKKGYIDGGISEILKDNMVSKPRYAEELKKGGEK